MKKNNRHCDLCDEIIFGEGNNRMVVFSDNYQLWDGKDICPKCCIILYNARNLGLIEYDTDQFFDSSFHKTTQAQGPKNDGE